VNDTSMQGLSPSFQLEIETLRDQRDLYRSLLLSEPASLERGMTQGLASTQEIQSLLRAPARDSGAFRGKIERLLAELMVLEESWLDLHLPTLSARLQNAQQALREIELRREITGNDLLPAMVVLGDLCSHITIAADCAAVHVPLRDDPPAARELETSQRYAQPRLLAALQQLTERLGQEHRKNVALVALGLEDIPESWISALFDLLAQLLRNAVEHGIEASAQRSAQGKPEEGTIVVEFMRRDDGSFELNMHDDGRGVDAERITRRGQGMQIVRDHVRRLGGRIQASTKTGQFTRYRIQLPALGADEAQRSA